MLHKSSTYCPRQISSSSLIFSMGAISMKVNPAFVSILIIASSLAIHLSIYIQPSYRLWGWAPFMALTPSLRCLRLLLWVVRTWTHIMVLTPSIRGVSRLSSWDGPNLDSYHGPHTFSRDVSVCRHETVCTWAHFMAHTPSVWGVSVRCPAAVCTWAHIMAHTPSAWGVFVRHKAVTSSFIGDVSSDSKILYHYMDLEEITATNHIERELRCTLRNLPSHFLCLELLCLSA